jgi:hypothetical protein
LCRFLASERKNRASALNAQADIEFDASSRTALPPIWRPTPKQPNQLKQCKAVFNVIDDVFLVCHFSARFPS